MGSSDDSEDVGVRLGFWTGTPEYASYHNIGDVDHFNRNLPRIEGRSYTGTTTNLIILVPSRLDEDETWVWTSVLDIKER